MHSVRVAGAVLALFFVGGPAQGGGSAPNADHYTKQRITVQLPTHAVDVTLAKPSAATPPPFVVIFASGDGGLHGVSSAIFEHLAERGYWTAGFSSPDAFEEVVKVSGPNYELARDAVAIIVAESKRRLSVSPQTPIVLTGMSRGASVVVAAGGDANLKPGIVGAVAIALTREFDELSVPEHAKKRATIRTDEKGRIQVYPTITRLGEMPLAVIQSTNDGYVKSAEWRQLLGPDTATRRLYEVKSSNHSFRGGKDALMRDLDDAMSWIGGLAR